MVYQKQIKFSVIFVLILHIFSINTEEDTIVENEQIDLKSIKDILNTKYDFCDVNQSRLAVYIIEEIRNFIDKKNEGKIKIFTSGQKNNECFIKNKLLSDYVDFFDEIDEGNKSSYSSYKCNRCSKKFKSKEFLYLHFKIFHLDKTKDSLERMKNINNNEKSDILRNYYEDLDNKICPADLCIFLNCKRYKNYLNLVKEEKSNVINRELDCNPMLENYYSKKCMKLVQNCFINEFDTFEFYKIFCESNRCEKDNRYNFEMENILFVQNNTDYKNFEIHSQKNDYIELKRKGILFGFIYNLMLYLVSIFTFIYILVLWITKAGHD